MAQALITSIKVYFLYQDVYGLYVKEMMRCKKRIKTVEIYIRDC